MASSSAQQHPEDGLKREPFSTADDASLYQPQTYPGYDELSPPFEIKREQSPRLQSTNPNQFADFPLYSEPGDQEIPGNFEYAQVPISSAGVNPADLSLAGERSENGSHQDTPSLHINPHHSPQPGSTAYLSTSSTQPSAGGFEWDSVLAQTQTWNTHRRAPSEYSEISSAAASPFLQNQEFSAHPSPLLQSQDIGHQGSMQDLLNSQDSFGIEDFTLSDRDPSPRLSPAPHGHHSERNSPYLLPQENHLLGIVPSMSEVIHPISAPANHGPGPTSAPRDEEFPQINVTFAPPQRQPTFPGKPGLGTDDGALSPPPKSPQRRQRSKSDPYAAGSGITRPLSAQSGSGSGANSPIGGRSRRNSLSPVDVVTAPVGSPGTTAVTASTKQNRRSSTNSLPNRDYILELAHPNRAGGGGGDYKRVQKHPATFQCTLCPKKFTRAYNLRSHLRTHTDERPFVCTICGKAFARQHDRKRHEGLHSGEKKFVCKGNLKAGGTWGCNRRFARADALGRHFRSEAGRVCIRPLLDEETAERQRNQMAMMDPHLQPGHDPSTSMQPPNIDATTMGVAFPSVLLEQFPALATVNWSVLDQGGGGEEYDDPHGSGFDASGGEYDDGSVSGGSAMNSHRNSYDGSGWDRDAGEVGYRPG